jgi:hypothetical protein
MIYFVEFTLNYAEVENPILISRRRHSPSGKMPVSIINIKLKKGANNVISIKGLNSNLH